MAAGVMLERGGDGAAPRWRLSAQESGPVHRGRAGEWEFCVYGAFAPALPAWIAGRLAAGTPPARVAAALWEAHLAHCAVFFVHHADDAAVVAVDPFAVAKAYRAGAGDRLRFGTSLPEVLAADDGDGPRIDAGAATYFLLNGYTPAFHTFFAGVGKVPPGGIVSLRGTREEASSYLGLATEEDLPEAEFPGAVGDAWEAGLAQVADAFPALTLSLSGGLDSSALLGALLRAGVARDRISTATGISLGPAGEVFNPYDRAFAARVAAEHGVAHREAPYRWDGPGAADDLRAVVADQSTEAALGFLFRAVGPTSPEPGRALLAAQNADSLLSFAVGGRPSARLRPPFVAGLGGWCTRFNLFGGLDRAWPEGAVVRALLRGTVRRRHGPEAAGLTLDDRVLGLAFHPLKLPAAPTRREHPHLVALDEARGWFLREYVEAPGLPALHARHPHGAFLWSFLHGYMQGGANRGTVWTHTLRQAPTFLPWASLPLLRLASRLRAGRTTFWQGKNAAVRLARERYAVPGYVLSRVDPPTPALDRRERETLFLNEPVHAYLMECAPAARRLLDGVVDGAALDAQVARLERRELGGANLSLLLRALWMGAVAREARSPAPPVGAA